MSGSMEFVDALLKEVHGAKLELQLDMSRSIFWAPPKLGPAAPAALVKKYRLIDEGYVAPPSLRTRLRRARSEASERMSLARAALRGDDLHEGCGDY